MAALVSAPGLALAQTWDSAGLPASAFGPSQTPSAPAPRRDLSGIWDAGSAGISGPGHVASPFTPWAQEKLKEMKPGNGPRAVTEQFINDPLNTLCDPAGFPRNVLYEFRPTQIVQTPNQVLMLYLYEKRWRVIWTDGRQLPEGSRSAVVRVLGGPMGGRLYVRRSDHWHGRENLARQCG